MNWKRILTTAIALTAVACVVAMQGCIQVIVEKDGVKYKVNTFCYKLDMDRFISESFQIDKYEGTPDKVKAITPYGVYETK
jgi:hypothetical protein